MIRLKKIKISEKEIYLEWWDARGALHSYGYTDDPHTELVDAFGAMGLHLREICCLENDERTIKISGLTVSRKEGVIAATITGMRDLGQMVPEMVVNTPHGSEWLSYEFFEALLKLEQEAETYIEAQRSQLEMFEDDGEQERSTTWTDEVLDAIERGDASPAPKSPGIEKVTVSSGGREVEWK